MQSSSFLLNVFDDYSESDPEAQNTYAYLDDDTPEADQPAVLQSVLDAVLAWKLTAGSPVKARLAFHDSAQVYPQLVGTDMEGLLYRRWEVKLERLSHEDREALVEALNQQDLEVNGRRVTVISES
jgi:hypothetical protein